MAIDFIQLLVSLHEVSLLLVEVVDIHEKVGSTQRGWEAASVGHQYCMYVDRAADIIEEAYRKSNPHYHRLTVSSQQSVSRFSTVDRMRRLSPLLTFTKTSSIHVAPVESDLPRPPGGAIVKVRAARVVPGEEPTIEGTSLVARRYLAAIRRLLYLTEFLLLVHSVEFIIPFVFGKCSS